MGHAAKSDPLLFQRSVLKIQPIRKRVNDLDVSVIRALGEFHPPRSVSRKVEGIAERMVRARKAGRAIIFMAGGHVIRSGVQRHLIDLMERGYISCIALNGAGMIHDFEFALLGATTESVARYIQTGEFGFWRETGLLNDIINKSYHDNPRVGLGQAVGQTISQEKFPYREVSLLCAGARLGIPVTVHVALGQDIIHQHPNCDGAATGALTYNDFLRFARVVQSLSSGVLASFGSAVMAPEVFLKALSMSRNVARQRRERIHNFSVLVCDVRKLPANLGEEAPKSHPEYYFRPWKTLLVRTLAGRGASLYLRARHDVAVPALWDAVKRAEKSSARSRPATGVSRKP